MDATKRRTEQPKEREKGGRRRTTDGAEKTEQKKAQLTHVTAKHSLFEDISDESAFVNDTRRTAKERTAHAKR
ncbi:hypothetical protein niasHT_007595 [Heterodera trifolii]|uniref:Uncharacterized protein n=1 Tax=Heterodera trifolii TaxID=157864 RepID=A0ABD2LQM0_9BILA